jgi:hypothetical protein
LLTRLRDLSELLLRCLERLLQDSELSLKLLPGLSCLGKLLLRGLTGLLQGSELGLSLVSGLCDPGQLLLGVCGPGLQVRQRCSGALLLVEPPLQGNLSLLHAAGFGLRLLQSI